MTLPRTTLLFILLTQLAGATTPPDRTLTWDASCTGTWTGRLGAAQDLPTDVVLTLWKPSDPKSSCGTFEEEFIDGNVAMPCHMRLVRCIGDSTLVTRGQTKPGFDCGLPEVEFSCSTGALVFRRPNTSDPDTTAVLVRKPEPKPKPKPKPKPEPGPKPKPEPAAAPVPSEPAP